MATSTTTLSAIRSNMESTMLGLTPTSMPSIKYTLHREQEFFQDWAIDNPQAALRTYQIRDLTTYEAPEVSDSEIEERTGTLEVMIAYPEEEMGRYSQRGNFRGLDDVLEEDREQLLAALGRRGHGNYPAGAIPVQATAETADEEGGSFLVLTLDIQYRRDVSS